MDRETLEQIDPKRGPRRNSHRRWFAAATAILAAAALSGLAAMPAQAESAATPGDASQSCPWLGSSATAAVKAQAVVSLLTRDEKLSLVHGASGWTYNTDGYTGIIPAVGRLCLPRMTMKDGPNGLRLTGTTLLPTGEVLASSWDPSLAELRHGPRPGVAHHRRGRAARTDREPRARLPLGPRRRDLRRGPAAGRRDRHRHRAGHPVRGCHRRTQALRGLQPGDEPSHRPTPWSQRPDDARALHPPVRLHRAERQAGRDHVFVQPGRPLLDQRRRHPHSDRSDPVGVLEFVPEQHPARPGRLPGLGRHRLERGLPGHHAGQRQRRAEHPDPRRRLRRLQRALVAAVAKGTSPTPS